MLWRHPPTAVTSSGFHPLRLSRFRLLRIRSRSSAVTVSVSAINGFTGTVNVSIQNLPSGVDALPNANFAMAPGASQSLTFSVSATAPIGDSSGNIAVFPDIPVTIHN